MLLEIILQTKVGLKDKDMRNIIDVVDLSKDEIKDNHSIACEFAPNMDEAKRTKLLDGWHKAVQSTSVHII